MAEILYIAGLAVLGGMAIYLFVQRMRNPDKQVAVPISDMKEIEKFKQNYSEPSEETSSSETQPSFEISQHAVNENMQDQHDLNQKTGVSSEPESQSREAAVVEEEIKFLKQQYEKQLQEIQEQLKRVEEEKRALEEALRREMSAKETVTLAEEEAREYTEAKQKIQKVEAALEQLTGENHRLKEINKGLKDKLAGQATQLQRFEEEYKNKVADHQARLDQATERIMRLSQKFTEIEQEREKGEQKVSADVAQLTKTVTQLTKERDEAVAFRNRLEEDAQSLKDFQHDIKEKERLLQFELTKHRAQALGWEQICEDFKGQLEKSRQPAPSEETENQRSEH